MTFKVIFWAVMLQFLTNTVFGSVTLSSHLDSSCPLVTLNCSAVDLQATTLRWYFDVVEFALYSISQGDTYPRRVDASNATYDSIVGGVNIMVLNATQNANNRDMASFVSTMRVNISALQLAEVSTIACGSFESRSAVNVNNLVQEPQRPTELLVELRYENFQLTAINVQWRVINSVCSVDYRVTLLDSEQEVITNESVPLDNCNNSICLFSVSVPSSEIFSVDVTSSSLGLSSSPISSATIYNSVESRFGVVVSNDGCVASAKCFATIDDVNNCSIQYSQKRSDARMGQVFGSLNSSSQFPLVKSSTQYFIQTTFFQRTNKIIIGTNFTSESGVRYTNTNISLLAISFILICTGAILVTVVVIITKCKYCHNKAKKIKQCCISVRQHVVFIWALVVASVIVVSLSILIAALGYAGLQPDTCNSDQDALFILAIIFSALAVIFAAGLVVLCFLRKSSRTDHGNDIEELSMEIVFGDSYYEGSDWVPNGKYAVCQVCKKNKLEKFSQHHCRQCKKLICGVCSTKKAKFEGKPERVCDVCYYGCRVNMGYVFVKAETEIHKMFMINVIRHRELKFCPPEQYQMAREGQVQISEAEITIKFSSITKVIEATGHKPKKLGWLEIQTKEKTICIAVLSGKFRSDLIICLKKLSQAIFPKELPTKFHAADTANLKKESKLIPRLLVASCELLHIYKYPKTISLDRELKFTELSFKEIESESLEVSTSESQKWVFQFDTVNDMKEWHTFLKELKTANRKKSKAVDLSPPISRDANNYSELGFMEPYDITFFQSQHTAAPDQSYLGVAFPVVVRDVNNYSEIEAMPINEQYNLTSFDACPTQVCASTAFSNAYSPLEFSTASNQYNSVDYSPKKELGKESRLQCEHFDHTSFYSYSQIEPKPSERYAKIPQRK